MKEHYVSHDCAVKLKELGFCGEVTGKYVDCPNDPTLFDGMLYQSWNLEDDEILAPRLDQAAAWIREYHNWHIIIEPKIWDGLHYDFKLWHKFRGYENANRGFDFSTYESALSAGIDKALELLGKEEKE